MQKLAQINGSRINDNNVGLMQKQFKDYEEKISELQKEREFVKQRQAKLRSDLETLNTREEFLQKERNLTRIQETRIKHQLEEILDAAKLLKTIESVDLSQPDSIKMIKDLRAILVDKTDLDESQLSEPAKIKQLEAQYVSKMKELELKEEQFNQCVVIIPESDENAIRLTTQIQEMKNTLDSSCNSLKSTKDELKLVGDQRRDKFMAFFSKVEECLPTIYSDLTRCEVSA